MRIIEEENLLENCKARGAQLIANLEALAEKHSIIGDVRGKGLFCGAELVTNRETREPAPEAKVQAVVKDCMAQGVIIGATKPLLARVQQHSVPVTGADLYSRRYRPHHRCNRSGLKPSLWLILPKPD
jgi:4-aminobutyrate aminotransferase-like enzyme